MNQVIEALELWVELTGIDPNAKKFRFGDLEIRSLNDELKESLTLDTTNLTTLMLLDTFSKDYMKTRTFTVEEMLLDYERVTEYLDKNKTLQKILSAKELEEQKEEFKDWLISALEHYDIENPEVYAMASSYEELGFLRRDALRSINTLQIHQFAQGDGDEESPKYVKQVHEFWNINSLIRTMTSNKSLSGISLNLIRDPLGTSSYFAFGIKNGETLTILTDKPSYVHPLQKYLTRRPGRDLSERVSRNHFPYELLDIELDGRGDMYVKEGNSADVAVYQPTLRALKSLKELAPDEVIWIVMMFSLIKEKFWDKAYRTKELSYTGEMVVNQEALTASMNSLNIQSYQSLGLSPIKNEEVSTEQLQDNWSDTPTGKNKWMEERYGESINEDILNLIGHNQQVPLLGESQTVHEISRVEFEERSRFKMSDDVSDKELMKLDSSMFGTKEEIQKNQLWTARYNQALMLQQEADREFEAREQEIRDFYNERVEGNRENLLKAIAHGEMMVLNHKYVPGAFGDDPVAERGNILHLYKEEDRDYMRSYRRKKLFTPRSDKHYGCYINGGKVTVVAHFEPKTPEALAMLCGCEVSELPDVLQMWGNADLYSGNHRLSNVDPMEWAVKNPWKAITFDVEVLMSKSAYNELQRKYGVPANKFWLKGE